MKITLELRLEPISGFVDPDPHEVAEAVLRKLNHPGLSHEFRKVIVDADDTVMIISSATLVRVQD